MRVIYAGGPLCSQTTFKRLLVLANEIAFSDRPSVTFDNWGTVGMPTPFSNVQTSADDPVRLVAHRPPGGPGARIYADAAARDLVDARVRSVLRGGLAAGTEFCDHILQPDATYGVHSGRAVAQALLADQSLWDAELGDARGFGRAYEIESAEGRRDTLRMLLVDTSIHVTTSLLGATELGLAPVADDPFLAQLLALRTVPSDGKALSKAPPALLAFEIIRTVIPDELLQGLTIPDIVAFRQKTRDIYAAWELEVNRLAAGIDESEAPNLEEHAKKLVAADLAPKMKAFQDEIVTARDAFFGSLIKSVTDWKAVPTLAVAVLHRQPLLAASLAVAGSAAFSFARSATDLVTARRAATRRHGVAYLVKLADRARRA